MIANIYSCKPDSLPPALPGILHMQIGMVWRTQACPLRSIRSGSAIPDTVQITKYIKILLPAVRVVENPPLESFTRGTTKCSP